MHVQGTPPSGEYGTHFKEEVIMSKQVEVTETPTLWASVTADFTDTGEDLERLAAASLVCTTRTTSLTVRTAVVTLETVNVGLKVALDVMPRSYAETEQALLDIFTPAVVDDAGTPPAMEADKEEGQ